MTPRHILVKTAQFARRSLGPMIRKIGPPPTEQELRVQSWHAVNGDATLRVDYDLSPSSLVFDVGGFEGDWAVQISGRYGSTVHIFEPVAAHADAIKRRFSNNPKVHVHPFGLSGSTRKERISLHAESSSLFKSNGNGQTIQLVDVIEFLNEHRISDIDLMKINIEGCEYELLQRLTESDFVSHIRDIQIQFHDFVNDAEHRMKSLQQKLAATHQLTYQFPFVWENWRRQD
jgi:FkbM family methyltransferase